MLPRMSSIKSANRSYQSKSLTSSLVVNLQTNLGSMSPLQCIYVVLSKSYSRWRNTSDLLAPLPAPDFTSLWSIRQAGAVFFYRPTSARIELHYPGTVCGFFLYNERAGGRRNSKSAWVYGSAFI